MVDGRTRQRRSGPFAAHLLNVSNHGACLFLGQVMDQTFHVFHSTREDDALCLELCFTGLAGEAGEPPAIPARPVWFDVYREARVRGFKMGVEFLVSPDGSRVRTIKRLLAMEREKRTAWWRTVLARTRT